MRDFKMKSIGHAGATRVGIWLIKHVIAPLDRIMLRLTRSRYSLTQRSIGSVALLTTIGRRSGQRRTTPVFHLREDARIIICNANPGFEKINPWVLNLRANPKARIQADGIDGHFLAREATNDELDRYWPRLVQVWPAYQEHFARSGQRAVFVLEPESALGHKPTPTS